MSLLLLLATDCSQSSARTVGRDETTAITAVTTDRAAYRLVDGKVLIDVRFTNTSKDPVYLSHCGAETNVFIERFDHGAWTVVYPILCTREQRRAVAVGSGASVTTSVAVRTDPPSITYALTPTDLTGTFRARVPAYLGVDENGYENRPLRVDSLTSPTFTIAP